MGPTRKLSELSPMFSNNFLVFDCPCNRCKDMRENPDAERNKLFCDARIRIPILPQTNGWNHSSGDFPDSMTLTPSISISNSGKILGGCEGWHGYLTDGSLVACE